MLGSPVLSHVYKLEFGFVWGRRLIFVLGGPQKNTSSYIHYDYGGNAGGTEVSLMILDHYAYTQDIEALQQYVPTRLATVYPV
jgi:hypothetical protein